MRIRREDVEHVREQSRIDEVVGEHVTLKAAGVGSLKGLCPFHDERTPSFHVRPHVGLWHCFGCGEGGDAISFVQKIDHLGFAEAVEHLANRLGYQVRYEDDGGGAVTGRRERVGQRQRLIDLNRVAASYYAEQLETPGDADVARRFLTERGFDRQAAERFGIGFAPRAGEALLRHLRGRGFTEDELLASGAAGQGRRGLYDRFRGRLLWPIRDVTGDVVGFGARRIFEDDRIEAKYLNTPETTLYRKSQVLYGVDLAKREIARRRQVVVVEGYTDVMACHLAGVETAVATCGTAFGEDHIRVVRRLLGDHSARNGEVIFTFDGDEAGQKAAMRAFEDDQRFVAQTFVAVARDGMDPCELRQRRGNEAVRELVESRRRMFEFAIRTTLKEIDLDSPEGRVRGLRAAAPMVARIRDASLRPEYARQLAGWLGMEVEPVLRAVSHQVRSAGSGGADGAGRHGGDLSGGAGARSGDPAARSGAPGSPPGRGAPRGAGAASAAVGATSPGGRGDGRFGSPGDGRGTEGPPAGSGGSPDRIDLRDPVARVEREALECMLQVPELVPVEDVDLLSEQAFAVPAHRSVHHAIRAAGGLTAAVTMPAHTWADAVRENAPDTVSGLVTELAVAPLPADSDEALSRYAVSVVLRVVEGELNRHIGNLRSRMQRTAPDDPALLETLREITEAEGQRRRLRERITGS